MEHVYFIIAVQNFEVNKWLAKLISRPIYKTIKSASIFYLF